MKPRRFQPKFPPALQFCLTSLIPGLLYGLILWMPAPRSIGATVRHSFNIWLLIGGVILYLSFKWDRSANGWLSLTSVAVLFGLGLSGLWSNAFSELQVAAGMLYFSDSSQYYFDAQRLLNGIPFSSFSARHPLPTLFTTLILLATGKNLQLTLAIMVFICSLCTALAGHKLKRIFGPLASAVFILSLFLFYRRFAGMLDSENLGLALGCLSFSCLFSISDSRKTTSLVGMILLSLALAARPGAFLILPAALLWYIFYYSGSPHPKLTRTFLGLFALSSGFILSLLTNSLLAEPDSRMYSNLAYTLYGVSQGGKSWERFFQDYPEYSKQPAVIAEQEAYRQAVQAISKNPFTALQGLVRSILGYFSLGDQSLYGFLCGGEITAYNAPANTTSQQLYRIVRLTALLISAAGIWRIWKRRNHPALSLTLAVLMGWLLSLPILPPKDAGMMRIFAASIPYLLLLPICGLDWFSHRINVRTGSDPVSLAEPPVPAIHEYALSLLLLLLTFSTPFLIKIHWSTLEPVSYRSTCSGDQMSYLIELNPGSFITLIGDDSQETIRFPKVAYADYLESVSKFHRKEIGASLASLPPAILLMNAIHHPDGFSFWAVLPESTRSLVNHRIEICGRWHPGFERAGHGFLIVQEYHLVKSR